MRFFGKPEYTSPACVCVCTCTCDYVHMCTDVHVCTRGKKQMRWRKIGEWLLPLFRAFTPKAFHPHVEHSIIVDLDSPIGLNRYAHMPTWQSGSHTHTRSHEAPKDLEGLKRAGFGPETTDIRPRCVERSNGSDKVQPPTQQDSHTHGFVNRRQGSFWKV